VDRDHLAAVIDPHEAGIAPDLDALAEVGRGDRVEGPAELDVVIGMHGGPGPDGAIEGLGGQRQEGGLLHRLEHPARHLPRGAVHARAGEVAAPEERAVAHVGEIVEGLATEKVLAGIGDPALDFRLSPRVVRHRSGRRTTGLRLSSTSRRTTPPKKTQAASRPSSTVLRSWRRATQRNA